MSYMLDCNITTALYNHVRKEQFGICSNTDTLMSMALNEMRIDLGCSSVVICYTPETCENSVIACNIVIIQQTSTTSCSITVTQSFDDP